MKTVRIAACAALGYLLVTQQALAGETSIPVPEIDGGGAIIAIGLVAGLVALLREKFFKR